MLVVDRPKQRTLKLPRTCKLSAEDPNAWPMSNSGA